MKIIDPGHVYELNWLDGDPKQETYPEENADPQNYLTFVKREGPGYPGNVGHHAGTTCQEVLRALIDRVKYLNAQIPDIRNHHILADLRNALWCFEHRAAERYGRELRVSPNGIELRPTCSRCGHVGCNGDCHI